MMDHDVTDHCNNTVATVSTDAVVAVTTAASFSVAVLGKLPSIEVGPTALAWPMTLTFNPLQAMVMTICKS